MVQLGEKEYRFHVEGSDGADEAVIPPVNAITVKTDLDSRKKQVLFILKYSFAVSLCFARCCLW